MPTAIVSIIPDLFLTGNEYHPADVAYNTYPFVTAATPWYSSEEGSAASTLVLSLPSAPPDTSCVFMLTVGISFGTPHNGGEIRQVKYAGSGRILALY
jgi:hypothetical protein